MLVICFKVTSKISLYNIKAILTFDSAGWPLLRCVGLYRGQRADSGSSWCAGLKKIFGNQFEQLKDMHPVALKSQELHNQESP